jgi:hypothetical protein
LKKIIRFHKRKPRWDLDKLYVQRKEVHDSVEENFVQSNVKVGMSNLELK